MMERSRAARRSRGHAKREAVTSPWYSQRVVPTKINGKTTYVIVSADEYNSRGYGTCLLYTSDAADE